jgi:hypothetical protein
LKARKRQVVLGLLLAFTVWPVAHIALVKVYDVNPWKLAGWGMYSAPQLQPHLRVFGLTPDDVGVYELSTAPAEVVPVLDEFLERRRVLRNLARPDEVARALLDAYSAIDGVRLVVVQPTLNRRTGMIEGILGTPKVGCPQTTT